MANLLKAILSPEQNGLNSAWSDQQKETMGFAISYFTGNQNTVVEFESVRDAANWLQETSELKERMEFYLEMKSAHAWSDERAGDFLASWLTSFLDYQTRWGSPMVAPDVSDAARHHNEIGLPSTGRNPIVIPRNVTGTVANCNLTVLHTRRNAG